MAHFCKESIKDANSFEQKSLSEIGLIEEIAAGIEPLICPYLFWRIFLRIYSYVHAAVLDSDGFEAFKEAGDVFDAELSSKQKHIYEKGSTEEAMDLYVNFRGRKPIIAPLLKVRGLDGSSD